MDEKTKSTLIIEVLHVLKRKVERSELIEKIGGDPNKNFDRDMNPHLESGAVLKETIGRKVFYWTPEPVALFITDLEPPKPPEPEILYTKNPETLRKYDLKDRIKAIVKKKGRITRQDLIRALGIDGKNISRAIKPLLMSGEIRQVPSGGEIVYLDSKGPIGPEQIRKNWTDQVIEQIPELTAFLEYRKIECGSTEVSVRSFAYRIVQLYKFLSNPSNPKAKRMSPHPIATITKADVRAFLKFCKITLKHTPKTEANYIAILKSYFNHCKKEGLIIIDPMEDIDTPRIPKKKQTDTDFNGMSKLVEMAPNFRDKAIIQFLFWTGARVSEVYNCNLEDIHWDTNEITLHGKFSKDRTIPMLGPVSDLLKMYIAQHRGQSLKSTENATFLNSRKTRLVIRGIKKLVHKTALLAGMDKVTCHSLRRACGRMLHEMGMDILEIAAFLGHENVSTTQIYINVQQERMTEEARKAGAKMMGGSPNVVGSQPTEPGNLVPSSIESPQIKN